MLSLRFMIVGIALLFMTLAGLAGWSLKWVLPLGMAVFILAWLARPVAELRLAFAGFRAKILLKEHIGFSALLFVIGTSVVVYLIVPLAFYGAGRLLAMLLGAFT